MHKLREYFNPRSHEGSDQLRSRQQPRDQISILAPTRGATHAQSDISYQTMISILAPTRGATADGGLSLSGHIISILAPTRGATQCAGNRRVGLHISILAPTRGATVRAFWYLFFSLISILAPTRGATFFSLWLLWLNCNFNPRSHEGSDFQLADMISVHDLFQSSLPRGERPLFTQKGTTSSYFNPRSHEGSDSNFRQKVLFSLSKNCLKYLILTTNYFN